MKHNSQIPCIRVTLKGEAIVDWRERADSLLPTAGSNSDIWAQVQQRRDPDVALFIEGRCVYRGAFVSQAEAQAKFDSLGLRPRKLVPL